MNLTSGPTITRLRIIIKRIRPFEWARLGRKSWKMGFLGFR